MSIVDMIGAKDRVDGGVSGVVVGVVKSNRDDEGLGRVKVSFPWRDAPGESHWARVAVPMAGDGRGMLFRPEEDDEVLVAFEHGDINHPYVIGALWNGRDRPPEGGGDDGNNLRVIKSRSGHEIIFDDNSMLKREKLEIKSAAGAVITLDDASGSEKIEIKDKTGSNEIIIDSTQNSITINASMRLKIKANMVEIEADSTMTIKAGATLTLQGAIIQLN